MDIETESLLDAYWNAAYQQGLEHREVDDEKGSAQEAEWALIQHIKTLRAQVSALQTENEGLYLSNVQTQKHADELLDKLHEAERQVDHWKKQHKNEVNRAYGLKGNAEIHQVRAYELMGELQGQIAALTIERDEAKGELLAVRGVEFGGKSLQEHIQQVITERDQLRVEVERLKEELKLSEFAAEFNAVEAQNLSTSYEKGAESMRERAAKAAEDTFSHESLVIRGTGYDIATAIRALPLEENEG